MLLPKCVVCGTNKLIFIKKQEVSELLSNLQIEKPLRKIPLLGNVFVLKALGDLIVIITVL